MNAPNLSFDINGEETSASKIIGVVTGIVTNNQDPDGMGRVKLKFPWLSDELESNWARLATPMNGKDRGFYFLPEVDDEVLVVFEHGDMRFPYVLGGLWNGKDNPPVKNQDENNNIRMIKSRSGHVIRLTDENGKEKIEIIDKSGENKLIFDTAANTISIISEKDIELTAAKGNIKLSAQSISMEAKSELGIKSTGSAKLEAQGAMDVKSSAVLNIKGSLVNIN